MVGYVEKGRIGVKGQPKRREGGVSNAHCIVKALGACGLSGSQSRGSFF